MAPRYRFVTGRKRISLPELLQALDALGVLAKAILDSTLMTTRKWELIDAHCISLLCVATRHHQDSALSACTVHLNFCFKLIQSTLASSKHRANCLHKPGLSASTNRWLELCMVAKPCKRGKLSQKNVKHIMRHMTFTFSYIHVDRFQSLHVFKDWTPKLSTGKGSFWISAY